MTSRCLKTNLRDVHYNQCKGERDAIRFLSDQRVRKFIQAKKISFVETGKKSEYPIWGASKT